ncbi:MAG: L,D-transpeptidase family protein [Planctomycetota bacterium]
MRSFIILLTLALAGYLGYRWLSSPPDPATEPSGGELSGSSRVAVLGSVDPPVDSMPVDGAPAPAPTPGEEDRLREQLADTEGAAGDPLRLQLAQLLFREGQPDRVAEARGLLRPVYQRGGPLGSQAAALLLRYATAEDGEARLEYARHLIERGPEAPGYARSCLELGRERQRSPEDSAQVEAWELLSKAYFATDDEGWRGQFRAELVALAQNLILSPRATKASVQYAVQPGDSLARIANQHGTTVELIRWLNGLKGDVIHPRQTFKILAGTPSVEVDKSEFRLDIRLGANLLYSTKVGLGQHGRTPLGEFVIEIRQEHPKWYPPGQPEVAYGHPDNPLGDYWLGFKDTELYSGYGIHGTTDNSSIGQESSQGCIRMRNDEVAILFRILPVGTRVTVRE